MTALLVFGVIAEFIALVACVYWWRVWANRGRQLAEEKADIQRRLDEARAEVSDAKEDARKRRGELVEAREQLRKAKRRRGRGSEEAPTDAAPASPSGAGPEQERLQAEVKRLTAALEGAEARVQRVQADSDAAIEKARESMRAEGRRELEGSLAELRQRVDTLTADLERARRAEKKAEADATPSSVHIDLEALAP
ncbi:MAG: hypothetical protein JXR83_02365, partial [Deltaproteobacteria bacterium]|nr:hypothetical protein [Deltaproteobacteria bacterium]